MMQLTPMRRTQTSHRPNSTALDTVSKNMLKVKLRYNKILQFLTKLWDKTTALSSSSSNSRSSTTLCPKKVSPLNISQQPPQTCTDLNEILHTQDDIYFCHRRQISLESLIPFTRCSILSNCCHKSQLPIQLTSCWRHLWKLMTCG